MRVRLILTLLFASLLLTSITTAAEAEAVTKIRVREIRVGITEYQHLEETSSRYYQLFKELTDAAGDKPITFKFAIGTYEEVKDWYSSGQIDVAILSAMPVAEWLNSARNNLTARDDNLLDQIKGAYIGTLAPNPLYVDFALKQWEEPKQSSVLYPRRLYDDIYKGQPEKDNAQGAYRTVCVVPADSKLKSFHDIQANLKDVKFLFVRPYSVSGYLIPFYYLQNILRLNMGGVPSEFTYQHDNSLKRLMEAKPGGMDDDHKYLVAFVRDKTAYYASDPSANYFRLIETPELNTEKYDIPSEAVIINHRLEPDVFDSYKECMLSLFDARETRLKNKEEQLKQSEAGVPANQNHEHQTPFKFMRVNLNGGTEGNTPDNWIRSYEKVELAMKSVEKPRTLPYRLTIDEIIEDLLLYRQTLKNYPSLKPLRLALVLSGGGAKCAYQAGAVQEIENKFREKGIKINLVVGTSGGAINALLVAMGISNNAACNEDCAINSNSAACENCMINTWRRFEQHDFFQPSLAFTLIFGSIFGFIQALLITTAALIFGHSQIKWETQGKVLVGIVITEALLATYLDYFHNLSMSVATWILYEVVILLALAGLFRLLRYCSVKDWWKQAGVVMVCTSLLEVIINFAQHPLTNLLGSGKSHWLQHYWLLITLFSSWSAPIPLLLGLLMLLSGYWLVPDFKLAKRRRRMLFVKGLAASLCLVLSAFLFYSFLKMDTPSDQAGIEEKFSQEIPRLIKGMHKASQMHPAPGDQAPLQDISSWIIDPSQHDEEILQRDLIITASRLPVDDRYESMPRTLDTYSEVSRKEKEKDDPCPTTSINVNESEASTLPLKANDLPDDLYFYFRRKEDEAEGIKPPPSGKQFIPFNDERNQDKLLDTVIGSSTMYPLFPYRQLGCMDVDHQPVGKIRIIDGGFIHNSPVDAAVKWGATHIILINASPQSKPFAPHSFLDNLIVTFNYLFSQAQNIDTHLKESVEMFELSPSSECDKLNRDYNCSDEPEPDMDAFDFSPTILQNAFLNGTSDVKSPESLFTRVLGAPFFRSISNEDDMKENKQP